MNKNNILKNTLVGTVSALALAVSAASSAVELTTVGDTKLFISGYAKLDMMYDVNGVRAGASGLGDSFSFGNIGVGGADTDGHFKLHANESRIGFQTITPTEKGDLTTFIEGDFWFGDFRLRHAYGSWNGITAGQTWTNFTTFIGTTRTLDFTSQLGRSGANRQSQIRYSTNGFHVALEAPHGVVSSNAYEIDVDEGVLGTADTNRKFIAPDLTLRYEQGQGAFKYAAAGMVRQIAYDDGANDDSVTGWGLTAAASYDFGSGTTLRGHVTGGDGVGFYLYSHTPMAAAYLQGGELTTIAGLGATIGVSQKIGAGSVNLAYSRVTADWDDAERDGLDVGARDETRQITSLNYIWSPTKSVTYGVEMLWGERETVAGDSGDAVRLQTSVIYNF